MYKYIYGPVPSRRLGISLGLDIVPHKLCNLNCIYCECGRTDKFTVERKEYYPADDICEEVKDYMTQNPKPEWLTLSGSGEPTLNSKAGFIINTIKKEFPDLKIALLTNGVLFNQKEVREEFMNIDLILPSLDGASENSYNKIDRPFDGLSVCEVINGLSDFQIEFKKLGKHKEMWLEVFIVYEINTSIEEIDLLIDAIKKINPDRVQLNSLDRPGAESWVKPAPMAIIEDIKETIDLSTSGIIIENIKKYKYRADIRSYRKDNEEAILEIIKRRPSTLADIEEALGIHADEINKYLDIFFNEHKIKSLIGERGLFFKSIKR